MSATCKFLKQGYKYHKIRKAFSKFYHRHSELIVKYNIGLKTLLKQGISEPIFYGDLVYTCKFKRIVGKPNISDHYKRLSNVIKWLLGYHAIVRKPPCELNVFVLQQQQNLGRRFGTSKMHF